MNLNRTLALTTVAAVAMAGVGLWMASHPAIAQTAAPAQTASPPASPPAAPAERDTSNIPRHIGTFSGGPVDQLRYTPACPAFVLGMSADAIFDSDNRAFLEGEARKFEQLRDRWDAYEDCLIENGRRDIESIRVKLGDTLSNAANAEATGFNALNAAAQANVARIQELAKKRKAPAKGAAPEPPVTSAWVKPEGRRIGTVSAGPAEQAAWASGCPAYTPEITAADFANAGVDRFNVMVQAMPPMPARIQEARQCRQDNAQEDYELIQKAVNDGVNAVYGPAKTAFETQYAAIRQQLNLKRQAGGALAPPELSRPAPKSKAAPARPAPAKKKK